MAFATERRRVNVRTFERWLSLAAGGALAGYGLRQRGARGGTMALAGAALLYRGATGHCDVYQALGVERGPRTLADFESDTRRRLGGRKGVHVEDSVTINRSRTEVYRFWRTLENLPVFMRHLEEVSMRDAGISHWVAKGPAGSTVSWDARIINDIENELIAWQSLEGSTVATAGSVHFDDTARGVRVRVKLQYDPPAGNVGALVARLFGEEPRQQVHEDLRRFKALMETGEIPTVAGQPSGRMREEELR